MTVFQLDECCSGNKERKACNNEGLSTVKKFPTSHKSLKDPEMLQIYMQTSSVLVTTDSRMVIDHPNSIPIKNPGILVIALAPTALQTITVSKAFAIISNFKKQFPDWHLVEWKNSVVKLTDEYFEAGRKIGDQIKIELYKQFYENDWQDEFRSYLAANSARNEII